MPNTLFLQSNVADPYDTYARMLAEEPVYWDEINRIWAVYSHDACQSVLRNAAAEIPRQSEAVLQMMSTQTATLVGHLARLGNPPIHAAMRQAVMHLFESMLPVDAAALLDELLDTRTGAELDLVDAVCKKLPALAVLKSFAFPESDIGAILPGVEQLTKVMLPNKTETQIADVNAAIERIHPLVVQHIHRMPALSASIGNRELLAIYAANLIGLLIQSYDAGRGILSNALLQELTHNTGAMQRDADHFQKTVTETLRFDPPIHNTRRLLADDMVIGGKKLGKGQSVLVVLAAANRDPAKFIQPDRYDIERSNNAEHLTFGAGAHMCAAKHFSMRLAADTLNTLFARYQRVILLPQEMVYEPLVNARLPKTMPVSLG